MKNKIISLSILVFVISSITFPIVLARTGLGLVWTQEAINVPEEKTSCLAYGVYNPFDEGVYATFRASDSFNDIIVKEKSEVKYIAPGTSHDEAESVKFCFKVGDVYEENCIVGLMCERKCTEDEINYDGGVVLSEYTSKSAGGTGSATNLALFSPLRIKVVCSPLERNWAPVYIAGAIIVLLAIGLIVYRKIRRKREEQGYKKNY